MRSLPKKQKHETKRKDGRPLAGPLSPLTHYDDMIAAISLAY